MGLSDLSKLATIITSSKSTEEKAEEIKVVQKTSSSSRSSGSSMSGRYPPSGGGSSSDEKEDTGLSTSWKSLEYLLHVGNVYTIRLEPYAEPSALTHGLFEQNSFWCVKIDWIKNSNGDVIYGNEWI